MHHSPRIRFIVAVACAMLPLGAAALAQGEAGWGATVDKDADKTGAKASSSQGNTKVSQAGGQPAGSKAPAAGATKDAGKPEAAAAKDAGKPAAKPETFGDWVRECRSVGGKDRCTLRQTVRDGKKRRIISLIAARSKETAFLELQLPLGLSIPYGVTLDLGGDVKVPTQLVDCGAAGCRSVLPLDDNKMALMKAAKSLAVSFQDSKTGKIITISGSVKGLADGLAKGFGSG